MKVKALLLTVSIFSMSLVACKPESETPFSFKRINYELTEGHTEDELQGAPWINANIPGQVAMVEQPSLKDDFYTSVNYEMFLNHEYGPFDVSSHNVTNLLNSIYNGSCDDYPNKTLFEKTRDLMASGSVSAFKSYLDNLDASNYITSKDVFLGNCGILRLYKESDTYVIEFNDGYYTGFYGYQTLAFFGSFADRDPSYGEYNQYGINIAGGIYNALGYENYQTMAETGHEFIQHLIYASQKPYVNYATVSTLGIDGLKSALLDAGLSLSDKIHIPQDYYSEVVNLYNVLSSTYAEQYALAIKTIVAFEHRHLLGLTAYRPISAYMGDLYQIFGEYNLNYVDDYAAKCYMTSSLLPLFFERAYLHFDGKQSIKDEVAELIEDILATYKTMIKGVKWLHSDSKEQIIKKLDKMDYTACYSDKLKNLPAASEEGLDTWNLLDVYDAYHYTILDAYVEDVMETNADLIGGMTSYTVNAFYDPYSNQFVILNGLVYGGFIGEQKEVTYARLGTVIGHEISHAFDSSGAYFNENGSYKEAGWWNKDDMSEFKNRVKKLRKFWSKINLYDNKYVQGRQIDGEAMADMGGVAVMLKLAKKIKNFDYDLFFRSYASLWKEEYYNLSSMDRDSHPYAYLRCNVTLAQFDEFVKTYHLKSGDGMYIPKNERVKIW